MSSLIKFDIPKESEITVIQQYVKYATQTKHYKKLIEQGGEGAIFLLLLTAREFNIPPIAALNGALVIVSGRVEMTSHMRTCKIRQAGHSMDVSFSKDEKTCYINGKRKDNGDTLTASYSMEDAVKAGLASKDTWKKHPKDMLYARALTRLSNRLFADAIGGITYAPGEIQEVVDDIEITPNPPPPPNREKKDIKESEIYLQNLELSPEEKAKRILSVKDMFRDKKDLFEEYLKEKSNMLDINVDDMLLFLYVKRDELEQRFCAWVRQNYERESEKEIEREKAQKRRE